MFGGHKSDFDGHSKESTGNLHVYASVYGDKCLGISAQILPTPGYPEVYANNTCILASAGDPCVLLGGNGGRPFPDPATFQTQVYLANNTVYVPGGNCTASGTPFDSYQSFQAAGFEAVNSTISGDMPSTAVIMSWAQALLGGAGARVWKH